MSARSSRSLRIHSWDARQPVGVHLIPAKRHTCGGDQLGTENPLVSGSQFCDVHLSDSLSNPTEAVKRLVTVLDDLGGLANVQVSSSVQDSIVTQSGAVDPGRVRLQVKENRKLSPAEVAEVVARYQAGASIRSLSQAFGMHEQTVRAHLRRKGVSLRPLRAERGSRDSDAVTSS